MTPPSFRAFLEAIDTSELVEKLFTPELRQMVVDAVKTSKSTKEMVDKLNTGQASRFGIKWSVPTAKLRASQSQLGIVNGGAMMGAMGDWEMGEPGEERRAPTNIDTFIGSGMNQGEGKPKLITVDFNPDFSKIDPNKIVQEIQNLLVHEVGHLVVRDKRDAKKAPGGSRRQTIQRRTPFLTVDKYISSDDEHSVNAGTIVNNILAGNTGDNLTNDHLSRYMQMPESNTVRRKVIRDVIKLLGEKLPDKNAGQVFRDFVSKIPKANVKENPNNETTLFLRKLWNSLAISRAPFEEKQKIIKNYMAKRPDDEDYQYGLALILNDIGNMERDYHWDRPKTDPTTDKIKGILTHPNLNNDQRAKFLKDYGRYLNDPSFVDEHLPFDSLAGQNLKSYQKHQNELKWKKRDDGLIADFIKRALSGDKMNSLAVELLTSTIGVKKRIPEILQGLPPEIAMNLQAAMDKAKKFI